jgi:hypothetical protein
MRVWDNITRSLKNTNLLNFKTRSLTKRKDTNFERSTGSLGLTERKEKDFGTINTSCKSLTRTNFIVFSDFAQVKFDFIGFLFFSSILQIDTN